jgi:hypothetical protein
MVYIDTAIGSINANLTTGAIIGQWYDGRGDEC